MSAQRRGCDAPRSASGTFKIVRALAVDIDVETFELDHFADPKRHRGAHHFGDAVGQRHGPYADRDDAEQLHAKLGERAAFDRNAKPAEGLGCESR